MIYSVTIGYMIYSETIGHMIYSATIVGQNSPRKTRQFIGQGRNLNMCCLFITAYGL